MNLLNVRRLPLAMLASALAAGMLSLPGPSLAAESVGALPPLSQARSDTTKADWLIAPIKAGAAVYRGKNEKELILDNGLVRRLFRIAPNGATVGFDNLMTGASLIRGVKPEAILSLDGKSYSIGGLSGQPEYAYLLPEWIDRLEDDPLSFQLVDFERGPTQAPFAWRRTRPSSDLPWPPAGTSLTFHYTGPDAQTKDIKVAVHYELYNGLPVVGKWITVRNDSGHTVNLETFTSEILAAVEADSAVDTRDTRAWRLPALELLSDYSFHGMDATTANRTTQWLPDPQYASQVNYERKSPVLLLSRPPLGPNLLVSPGGNFTSFRTYVVVHDSDSRERQGLVLRRAQRFLAPWITENPIMMHVRSAESRLFRAATDQCAEVGFEMIIYTFGSGLNLENESPEYLSRVKADVDYAHAHGIQVGAYSLLASRRINDANDVINPQTGKTGGAIFENSPCLGSRWADDYFRKVKQFIEKTGLDLLEHDGSYPGDVCASTNHPGHRGLEDSQWTQWEQIADFYAWCRERGVYLNVPDYYFLAGSSKTGMGYRESNWSLPRARQIILGRQNIFDGTWTKTPSMGWMFVPLTEYQGGGAAATLEPLREHLADYEAHLINNFAAGVQACYRGPRLYDAVETKALVKKWVDWFKQHRAILESDIIHVRRANGRDIDGLLHVNPRLKEKGLAVIWNPLNEPVERLVPLPLYYTGLTRWATIREKDGRARSFALSRDFHVDVPVRIAARGFTWLVIE